MSNGRKCSSVPSLLCEMSTREDKILNPRCKDDGMAHLGARKSAVEV